LHRIESPKTINYSFQYNKEFLKLQKQNGTNPNQPFQFATKTQMRRT